MPKLRSKTKWRRDSGKRLVTVLGTPTPVKKVPENRNKAAEDTTSVDPAVAAANVDSAEGPVNPEPVVAPPATVERAGVVNLAIVETEGTTQAGGGTQVTTPAVGEIGTIGEATSAVDETKVATSVENVEEREGEKSDGEEESKEESEEESKEGGEEVEEDGSGSSKDETRTGEEKGSDELESEEDEEKEEAGNQKVLDQPRSDGTSTDKDSVSKFFNLNM